MCNTSRMAGCSAGLAFDNLKRAPGPGGDGTPIKNGDITELFVGPTQHFIDEQNLTIRNVAMEGHWLSGVVTRQAIQGNNDWIYIKTSKEGPFTPLNFLADLPAKSLWRDVDLRIQRMMYQEAMGGGE